jgi:hypothetical protein
MATYLGRLFQAWPAVARHQKHEIHLPEQLLDRLYHWNAQRFHLPYVLWDTFNETPDCTVHSMRDGAVY